METTGHVITLQQGKGRKIKAYCSCGWQTRPGKADAVRKDVREHLERSRDNAHHA